MDEDTTILRFVAEGKLSSLVKLLRCLGFDCLYDGAASLRDVIGQAAEDDRILLTTSPFPETRRVKVHRLLQLTPDNQLKELEDVFNLSAHMRPFTICLKCNPTGQTLAAIDPSRRIPEGAIPESVIKRGLDVSRCSSCGRYYWNGSHVARMRARFVTIGLKLEQECPSSENRIVSLHRR